MSEQFDNNNKKIALIIGAGPAGISAGYKFVCECPDIKPIIIEAEDRIGGLSKTVDFNGLKADVGGHRFFSKDKEILELWNTILPNQSSPAIDDILLKRDINFEGENADPEKEDIVMLKRRRFSRIYYMKKFFDYPVKMNLRTVLNLGIIKTFRCGLSYIKSCIFKRKENNLEDFMINRFGKALYNTFFEFYTEKVWGRKPKNISKEWGEQRIKGLSLMKALLNKFSKAKETSLIEEYYYPKLGSGQMWDEMAKVIWDKGGDIYLNTKVVGFELECNKIVSVLVENKDGVQKWYGDYIISSMPIKDLINGIECDNEIKEIANNLPYRDYQMLSFYLKDFNLKNNTNYKTIDNICPDSWIYIQDRNLKTGRIYIPKHFSPYLVENIHDTLICLEYFCDKGDPLWNMSDGSMIELGISELLKMDAIKSKSDILDCFRLKAEKAYPAYFDSYRDFDKIKDFINSIQNLYCIGRNGQHKYNNMDHSTLSGIKVCEIIKNNLPKEILWEVNTEKSYQETV